MKATFPLLPDDGRILFFNRDRVLFGFLSNFEDAQIVIDGETWRSTEFYYQSQKSNDAEYKDAIRAAKDASHAKVLATDPRVSPKAKKRSWFRDRERLIRADWQEAKLGIMLVAVRAKFAQNPELGVRLLTTGDCEIFEDANHEAFWGWGRDGQGANHMGRLLMQVRRELREAIC